MSNLTNNTSGLQELLEIANTLPDAATEVEQASPTLSINASGYVTASVTQEAGYVAGGTKTAGMQIAAIGATTYTPGTTNQTISSMRYLSGAQTILGDADLKAENIVEGVSIFNVAGTAKKATAAFVEVVNNSSADARMYVGNTSMDASAYYDIGGGGSGSAYTVQGTMVVIRCGASCTATATSGCTWVMNVTGTSYRVFAFLITGTAKITVTNV